MTARRQTAPAKSDVRRVTFAVLAPDVVTTAAGTKITRKQGIRSAARYFEKILSWKMETPPKVEDPPGGGC